MLEVGLQVSNEMMKYEPLMDEIRALILASTAGVSREGTVDERIFSFLKKHTRAFALDILKNFRIQEGTANVLIEESRPLKEAFSVSATDLKDASRKQLCARGGFWEMRRYFGQFDEMTESIAQNPPDHIVAVAVSGCVIAEYLAARLERDLGVSIPVDHMIFSRKDRDPLYGYLSPMFTLSGPRILLVEDVVQESRTVNATIETLNTNAQYDLDFSLAALEIDTNPHAQQARARFSQVFTFEE